MKTAEEIKIPAQCLKCENLRFTSIWMDGTKKGPTCFKIPVFYKNKKEQCEKFIKKED